MNAPADPLKKMVAEWRIRDTIGRYARGVDRREVSIIRECFHPGALAHYGDFDGDIESFIPWVIDYVASYQATIHFMGNTIIDWPTANVAIAETYALVFHEVDHAASGKSWLGGIRYIDRFECCGFDTEIDPIWRIAERTVVGDRLRIDPDANHRRFAEKMLVGQPDGADPIFGMLSKFNG